MANEFPVDDDDGGWKETTEATGLAGAQAPVSEVQLSSACGDGVAGGKKS